MKTNWSKLQNGTDIRGVALEGIPGEKINLTEEVVEKIGYSFSVWVSKKLSKNPSELKFAVGNDSRLSADSLKKALIKGLSADGSEVFDCGLASTPAMFMTTVVEGYLYDASIMITASHLPFNRNGLKFFTNDGGLEHDDIEDILHIAEDSEYIRRDKEAEAKEIDFISVYSDIFVKKIREEVNSKENWDEPLKGLKIIVDAGNGAGGFFAEKVLKPLGADTEGSQFLDPDGRFPNHIPNPEKKEAMEAIQNAVLESKADFGIIFDTDVDRAAVVDRYGNAINRNSLIALISAIILEEHPGSTIVTDSVTSNGLKKFIEEDLNGVHHRFKRGYKNVINESIRLNEQGVESHLAIETSGHGAIKENYFLDDGAYLTAKILIKMAKMKLEENKDVTELIQSLETPLISNEYRITIKTEDFATYGKAILEDLNKYAEAKEGWVVVPNNFEGVRVDLSKDAGDGWFLVRMSLHDPVIPINIESNSEEGIKIAEKTMKEFMSSYDLLDLSCFK
ncbi:phosphomannomutase/phosphoglucomutase [Clostridium grantii]|uniref:Phosphomannomutase n=1 Tax=Clostridium grantii DSM 8605 TaxID=1121316 RepID=A0A1M5XD35_9CLOT|nr:phosphomannomutase/phosphoglucomutase [Clostridium grantii]SHH97686.1 Phosphomannomutase [Clostridium grantii DSM 8605]